MMPTRTSNRRLPASVIATAALAVPAIAAGIAFPVLGVVLVSLCLATYLTNRIVREPKVGLFLILCLFPLYPAFRALIGVYQLPIPTQGLRFWPELILIPVYLSLVVSAIRNRQRLSLIVDDIPFLVWLVSALYGATLSLLTQHPFFTIFGLHYALTPPLLYFATRWGQLTPQNGRQVLRLVFATFTLFALVSLMVYVLRPPLALRMAHEARPQLVPSGINPMQFWRLYSRMQSLLFEENVWGSLCGFVALLGLARLTIERRGRLWVWALVLLATICLALSVARFATVGWLVGVGVLLLLRSRYRWRVQIFLAVCLMAAGGAFMLLANDPRVALVVRGLQTSGLDKGRFAEDRSHQWVRGLEIFQNNPSGIGIGTVGYAASNTGIALTIVADGNYFSVAGETGVFGLLCLAISLIGLAIVLVRGLQRRSPHAPQWLGMGLLAYLADITVHALTANTFEYYYTFPLFALLTGLFVTLSFHPATPTLSPAPSPQEPPSL